ncbi:MAG: UDP-N-acetylmuramate dehydrogenase [Acidobacteriota bacterium]
MIAIGKSIVEQIAADYGAEVRKDRLLKDILSMGVGGKVSYMVFPSTIISMERIIREFHANDLSFHILGAGTNIVAGDEDLEDVVIATDTLERTVRTEGNFVRASSGLSISRLIRSLAESGLGGLEFAEGIPGSLGGAVMMNAGSYGHSISEFIREISYIDRTGRALRRKVSQGDFSYRKSPLSSGSILTEILFEFMPREREEILAKMDEVRERRRRSQPQGVRSSGCIFKNPEGDHAGRIIESVGLKGLTRGGAIISPVHANFIVNMGEADADDIFWLIDKVKEVVLMKAGILLEEEVVIWRR